MKKVSASNKETQKLTGYSRASLSRILDGLKEKGLVKKRREEKYTF